MVNSFMKILLEYQTQKILQKLELTRLMKSHNGETGREAEGILKNF